MEQAITKNQLISELCKSTHGELASYVSQVVKAAAEDPNFVAHLIAWNERKGQIRDSKVALPIASLKTVDGGVVLGGHDELVENSLAHVALLRPRELLRAYKFAQQIRPSKMHKLRAVIRSYMEVHERRRDWDKLAIQHRAVLKELGAMVSVKHRDRANVVLHGRHLDKIAAALPDGSVFETVARLKDMPEEVAAAEIVGRRIPFQIALGALGAKAKEPGMVLALIKNMTPVQLVTNAKLLERLGMKQSPVLRAAFEQGLETAAKSKANVLKTGRAAEAMEDKQLKAKLVGLQERQLDNLGVEGTWAVLADKSGSMAMAMEVAKHIAAFLARVAKGKVHLVLFDTGPSYIDVTGLELGVIQAATKHFKANGWTSIGCGVDYLLVNNTEVDGIAVVSDGGDNTVPYFHNAYQRYCKQIGKEVPVYFWKLNGDPDRLTGLCQNVGIKLETFPLTDGPVDYYSIPNMAATMRTNRYSLVDEIMATPLLTIAEVLHGKQKVEEEVEV